MRGQAFDGDFLLGSGMGVHGLFIQIQIPLRAMHSVNRRLCMCRCAFQMCIPTPDP